MLGIKQRYFGHADAFLERGKTICPAQLSEVGIVRYLPGFQPWDGYYTK